MNEITLKSLGQDIHLVQGLLDTSLCEHLIEVLRLYEVNAATILFQTIDNQVRNNDLLYLGEEDDSLLDSTNNLLFAKIGIVQELLYKTYGIQFPYAEPCSILRYREGQFYKRHVDNLLLSNRLQQMQEGIPTRDVSLVGYLNEDFEGGETYFDRQKITVKPEKGSVLIFPSYFTHPHESLPVIKGEKYAFTSWLFS